MRPVHWLFVVSVVLFASGIGFIIAAERRLLTAPAAAAPAAPAVAPVATSLQVMEGLVIPAAAGIWDSIVTDVTAAGIIEKVPQTDAEWAQVATHAAMLIESANLLVTGPRAVDQADWPMMASAMADSAAKALKAAERRARTAFSPSATNSTVTCNNCHARYQRG